MSDKNKDHEAARTTDDSSRNGDSGSEDADRFTGDGAGERGYRGDSAPDTPPGSVPGGSHGAGGGYRHGGFDSGESEARSADERSTKARSADDRSTETRSTIDSSAEAGSADERPTRARSAEERSVEARLAAERQEWRDGFGAYGIPGYAESRAAGPRSGYGEQGFGAGENQGGRWGGGNRGGYGGGNPGGVHGTRGGSWAAAGERFEQGRGPRSYGPDGWGGDGPTPGRRDTGWGRGSTPGNRPQAAGPGGSHSHESHGVGEPPWRQSEFAGRGEFGDRDRGTWTEERGYSSHADLEHRAATADRWSVPGPFSGRGPRDYHRSEAAIREDVCERLTRHGHIDASDVRVDVENGEVVLEGTVDNRQAKRMAEDVAETVAGVRDIHNRLRIRYSEQDHPGRTGPSER